ncbi:MAG: hypothetical protein GYB65_01410 [Chloroflexi bacterium]|nr:hypothetical protein [Chloroflexota bacterium]
MFTWFLNKRKQFQQQAFDAFGTPVMEVSWKLETFMCYGTTILLLLCMVAFSIFALVVAGGMAVEEGVGKALGPLAAGVFVGGVLYVVSYMTAAGGHKKLYVFTDGLAVLMGPSTIIEKWDAIETVIYEGKRIQHEDVSGRKTEKMDEKFIISVKGTAVKIDMSFTETKTLVRLSDTVSSFGLLLQANVTEHQWPVAKAAYANNEVVNFGALEVDRHQIKQGKATLPVAEIQKITVSGGEIVIFTLGKKGKQTVWKRVPVNQIRNVWVLLLLLSKCVGVQVEGMLAFLENFDEMGEQSVPAEAEPAR